MISAGSCLMFILFVVKNDSNEVLEIEKLMTTEDPEMHQKIYNNENYMKSLKLWLPFLNKRGFLDTMYKKEVTELKSEE